MLVRAWRKTALFIAVEKNNIEIVKALYTSIGGGSGEELTKKSVIYEALNNFINTKIIKILLSDEKIDVNFVCKNTGDTSYGDTLDDDSYHHSKKKN